MNPTGYYTFQEASRLASFELPAEMAISTRRLRGWFRPKHAAKALIRGDEYSEQTAISFLGLIDATVALRLVRAGVSPRALRRLHDEASEILGTPYPFARDGIHVSETGDVHLEFAGRLIDLKARQFVFPEIVLPFLRRIDYRDHEASRWRIADRVTIDPSLRAGSPVEETSGLPTELLAAAAIAEGTPETPNIARAAWWYGVTEAAVESALAFESALAQPHS